MDSTAASILQLLLALLSVPVVAAIVKFLGRALLPAERLRSTLKSDLALFKDMPASSAKDAFEAHINRIVALLNVRLQPERWTRRKEVLSTVFGLLGALTALIAAATLIISSFVIASASGALPVLSAVVAGAGAMVSMNVYERRKLQKKLEKVEGPLVTARLEEKKAPAQ